LRSERTSFSSIKEFHSGRHPRQQCPIRIGHFHDDCVTDHVLRRFGLQPDLSDRAGETAIWIRLHGEARDLSLADTANVTLIDGGQDLHPRKVFRDQEQLWRREAGGYGLPCIDISLHHDAVVGCVYDRISKVALCALETGFRRRDVRLADSQVVGSTAVFRLGDHTPRE